MELVGAPGERRLAAVGFAGALELARVRRRPPAPESHHVERPRVGQGPPVRERVVVVRARRGVRRVAGRPRHVARGAVTRRHKPRQLIAGRGVVRRDEDVAEPVDAAREVRPAVRVVPRVRVRRQRLVEVALPPQTFGAAPGTVSVAAGSTAVTGSSTTFMGTVVAVGDSMTVQSVSLTGTVAITC